MLIGRFGSTTARPYVEGCVIINIGGTNYVADVSFLIDTGADSTMVGPSDFARFGIPPGVMPPFASRCGGIGGGCRFCTVGAATAFVDRRQMYVYAGPIGIPDPSHVPAQMPSILGRDILHRWRVEYNYSKRRLRFEVITADVISPLSVPFRSFVKSPGAV